MKLLSTLLTREALSLTLALEGGKGLESRVRAILDATRRRELLSRRALIGIGVGTALSVSLVALVGPRRTLPGKGKPLVAEPLSPAWPTEISGQVLLPDGSPAAGATIWFQHTEKGQDPRMTLVGQADSQGRYHYRVSEQGERFIVLAQKEGYGLGGTQQANATIPLSRAVTARFQLRDDRQEPLADLSARVATISVGKPDKEGWFAVSLLGAAHGLNFYEKTDAQGIATFTGLPENATVRLATDDAHYAPCESFVHLADDAPGAVIGVTLSRAGIVSGRVLGSNGAPRAGIKVAAQGVELNNGWASALTDASGSYTLTQLPPGSYNVALDLDVEDRPEWTARAHEGVTLKAEEAKTGLDFTLERGCLIAGRVLGADDRPIVGYSVGVYGPAHPQSSAWVQVSVTDAKGRYQLRVPAGKQHLYLQGGDPPLGYALPKDPSRNLTLTEGQNHTEDFILPRSELIPPVTGTVLDATGAPVADAKLLVDGKNPEDAYRYRNLKTDANGRFSLALRDKKPLTVYAEHKGRFSKSSVLTPAGQDLTLRLAEVAGTLTGQVLRRDGGGAGRVNVVLFCGTGGMSTSGQQTLTDAKGRFTFTDLVPGRDYFVTVGSYERKGMIIPSHQSETVVVPSGATVALKPLRPKAL